MMFTNGLNIGLALQGWVEKRVHGVETYWLSGKENVLGAVFIKKGHTDYFLEHEKDSSVRISQKKVQPKRMLPITNSLDNISLSLLKGLISIDFLGKGATVKNVFHCQIIWQYFTLFIEGSS